MKKKYFLYDPENGFETYETKLECEKAAEESIEYYLDDFWNESVTNLVIGVITHSATKTDVERQPEDQETAEEEGWDEDCKYRCNYKMLPIET
ncbi:MAG: hypothetical protein COA47_10220 [Robiginitomaculum sp.]|nr:MAG: hypothetical protein COA47_10220 [Robiginitomaculum sp.]